MRCAVISGITGYLGRELASQLVNEGVHVHGLTRQDVAAVPAIADGVQIHRIDSTTESVTATFERIRPDIVFHLAALARREHRVSDIVPFVNANVLLGTQLLEAARQVDCYRFMTAGSYLQYTESGAFRAFNLYAALKQAFEDVLAYYAEAYGFAAAILTVCNLYSEKDPRPTLITDMARACVERRPMTLHAGEAWVDLLHFEDAAAAFVKAAALFDSETIRPAQLLRYSVTSGRDINSFDLAEAFSRVTRRQLVVERGATGSSARRVKPWRGPTVPGWSPRVSLDAGIARIVECRR
jgi:nucleoside-diphosphate-sugar epimerase